MFDRLVRRTNEIIQRKPMGEFTPERLKMFGPTAITYKYDLLQHYTVFHLPNGIIVTVPDEILAAEKFDMNPKFESDAYASLSFLVIRARL